MSAETGCVQDVHATCRVLGGARSMRAGTSTPGTLGHKARITPYASFSHCVPQTFRQGVACRTCLLRGWGMCRNSHNVNHFGGGTPSWIYFSQHCSPCPFPEYMYHCVALYSKYGHTVPTWGTESAHTGVLNLISVIQSSTIL